MNARPTQDCQIADPSLWWEEMKYFNSIHSLNFSDSKKPPHNMPLRIILEGDCHCVCEVIDKSSKPQVCNGAPESTGGQPGTKAGMDFVTATQGANADNAALQSARDMKLQNKANTDATDKAYLVANPTPGNFAGPGAAGNLTDRESKTTDFILTGAIGVTEGVVSSVPYRNVPVMGNTEAQENTSIQGVTGAQGNTGMTGNTSTIQAITGFIKLYGESNRDLFIQTAGGGKNPCRFDEATGNFYYIVGDTEFFLGNIRGTTRNSGNTGSDGATCGDRTTSNTGGTEGTDNTGNLEATVYSKNASGTYNTTTQIQVLFLQIRVGDYVLNCHTAAVSIAGASRTATMVQIATLPASDNTTIQSSVTTPGSLRDETGGYRDYPSENFEGKTRIKIFLNNLCKIFKNIQTIVKNILGNLRKKFGNIKLNFKNICNSLNKKIRNLKIFEYMRAQFGFAR